VKPCVKGRLHREGKKQAMQVPVQRGGCFRQIHSSECTYEVAVLLAQKPAIGLHHCIF
jgi:hypothetical protein